MQALLDSLRSSQAWMDLQRPSESADLETTDNKESPVAPNADFITGSSIDSANVDTPASRSRGQDGLSVASLLNQLQSHPAPFNSRTPIIEKRAPITSRVPHVSMRGYSLQQSLPILSQLSDDPAFVSALTKVSRFSIQS